MRAEMNENGVITLSPETSAEAFALSQWASIAVMPVSLSMQNEDAIIRGSMLMIKTSLEEEKAA